jgi:hypothetical protein
MSFDLQQDEDKKTLVRELTLALLNLTRDEAYDLLRQVFLEDEEAIPEISFNHGGFDELAFEPLYARLIRGSGQQLRRLARRLAIAVDETPGT